MGIKIHLGAGPVIKPGWLNYDMNPGPGGIQHDLTRPLPLADGSADYVFSEHFIEHITREQALRLLRECHRVMREGAVIRITTPNLRILAEDYLAGKIDRWIGGWAPKTPAQFLNEGMTAWGHQFTYDGPELALILEEAGFTGITPAPHGEHEARGWSGEITFEAMKP